MAMNNFQQYLKELEELPKRDGDDDEDGFDDDGISFHDDDASLHEESLDWHKIGVPRFQGG